MEVGNRGDRQRSDLYVQGLQQALLRNYAQVGFLRTDEAALRCPKAICTSVAQLPLWRGEDPWGLRDDWYGEAPCDSLGPRSLFSCR